MPKVYLSPAYHRQNNCAIDGCYETAHNNDYLDALEPFLKACGIEYKRGPRRIPMSDNEDGTAMMKQAVEESDAFGADIHYVSHTNASTNSVGGGTVKGCRPIIFSGSLGGRKLGQIMVKHRREVYPYDVRLNERSDLYELNKPVAVSFYEEHVFHDNPEDALWFHQHLSDVARSACKGFCEYFGIPFVEPGEEKTSDGGGSSTQKEEPVQLLLTFANRAEAESFREAMKNAEIK